MKSFARVAIISALALIALVLYVPTADAATPALAGKKCATTNKTKTKAGVKYKCQKLANGKRLVVVSTKSVPASEIRYIKTLAKRIVEDVAETDCRARDGIQVQGSLYLLADDFGNVAENSEVPPGVNKSKYRARASTLADFAERAADEISDGSYSDGLARYQVVKKETKPLLASINRSLGTQYKFTYKESC